MQHLIVVLVCDARGGMAVSACSAFTPKTIKQTSVLISRFGVFLGSQKFHLFSRPNREEKGLVRANTNANALLLLSPFCAAGAHADVGLWASPAAPDACGIARLA